MTCLTCRNMLHMSDPPVAARDRDQTVEKGAAPVWRTLSGKSWGCRRSHGFPSWHLGGESPGVVISYRHRGVAWLNAARRGRAFLGCTIRIGTYAGKALEDQWI
ncbi:hypothetical protein Hesp01_42700 [Herbidospora sp. NBRC 101105]|nr:hypothetical protein Hesp01_42700 [Herbidospora sp. NBRC 101105]